jgi:hypothetical protein
MYGSDRKYCSIYMVHTGMIRINIDIEASD